MLCVANRPIFFKNAGELTWKDGAAVTTSPGKSTLAFIRKMTKHYAPVIPENHEIGKLKPPKWLVENYKRNCPRNYKSLIEAYGETRTKYDAPLPGEVWRKGKPVGINLVQTEYRGSLWGEDGVRVHRQPIITDYRGQYYTLTDWARFKRRAERAKTRAALHASRSPQATVDRLYSQLRDLFGSPLTA